MTMELVWIHDNTFYCKVIAAPDDIDPLEIPGEIKEIIELINGLYLPWMLYREGYCSHTNAEKLQHRFGNADAFIKKYREINK
jgi:hypothetical protein